MKRALSGWEFLTDMRDNKESSLLLDEVGLSILSAPPPDNLDDFLASENNILSSERNTLDSCFLVSPNSRTFLAVSPESFLLRIFLSSDGWATSARSEVSECSALVSAGAVGLTVWPAPALTVVPRNLSDSSIFSSGHLLLEGFSSGSSSSVLSVSVFILLSSFIILVMS